MNADMIIKEKISVMISVDRRLSSYKKSKIWLSLRRRDRVGYNFCPAPSFPNP
ncbi:MAG: hypothetical protein Q8O04_03595 [Deltaproteobacteria bacterium]|nr:hypothetical protein [Deltaproteobacteria bacterium]